MHPSHSMGRPEHGGVAGSQLYYTWEQRGQAVRWEQHTQTQQQGGSNRVEHAQEHGIQLEPNKRNAQKNAHTAKCKHMNLHIQL